jgi:hypothetical protein
MTEHISPEPIVCETCNTSPKKQTDGVIRCKCLDKHWRQSSPIRADATTAALLKQKGFDLAGCGWYYYGSDGTLITIFNDNTWLLEYAQTSITDLGEYLRSLPDQPSPTFQR